MWITTAWQCILPEVTEKAVKSCCMSSVVDGTDGDKLWNVRSECEEDEDTDCEDADSDTEW
jgi:hypothetical protein